MRSLIVLVVFGILLVPLPGKAGNYVPGPAVQEAVKQAEITSGDSTEQKVKKALRLLSERHYFQPKGPPTQLAPPFDHPYHLDSLRSPDEILEQKRGGGCASFGLSIAAMLVAAGVPQDDIRVLGTVVNSDLSVVCPQSGKEAKHPRVGLSGHIFVLVRTEAGKWRLFNSTDVSSAADAVDFISPEEIQKKMSAGPLQLPLEAYTSMTNNHDLPKSFKTGLASGMTVFSSWKPGEYPRHTFSERFNLVASGDKNNGACRYGAKEIGEAAAKLIAEKAAPPPVVADQPKSGAAAPGR